MEFLVDEGCPAGELLPVSWKSLSVHSELMYELLQNTLSSDKSFLPLHLTPGSCAVSNLYI